MIVKGNVFTFYAQLVYLIALGWMILRAQKGLKTPEVHKLPGLDAIDEAIGRCTEMGRPVHYSPGIKGPEEAETLAGLSILKHVASRCAKYDTPLICTVALAVTHPLAEEVIKGAYLEAGKSDYFRAENVRFISDSQFAYALGVGAVLSREQAAASILCGSFYGESLFIAELGARAGAIQIAGTANVAQIPFFVAACDYALIGEEIFAASAYLSGDPILLGTLIVQDWGKFAAVGLILLGTIAVSMGNDAITNLLKL